MCTPVHATSAHKPRRLVVVRHRRQGVQLLDLPAEIVFDIINNPPHSRQLCKRLLAAFGPLPSLAPRGLHSMHELLSALQRGAWYNQLRRLDLKHAAELVTDHTLDLVCNMLPSLQELHVPAAVNISSAGLAAALPSLTRLPALCLPSSTGIGPHALTAIGNLTGLRDLALPTTMVAAAAAPADSAQGFLSLGSCKSLASLSFGELYLEFGRIDLSAVLSCAAQLPALQSLAVDVVGNVTVVDRSNLAQLEALSNLTALQLSGVQAGRNSDGVIGQLLGVVGGLTALRSLRLGLPQRGWSPAAAGWLPHLSMLQILELCLTQPEEEGVQCIPGALDNVLSSVTLLRQLSKLKLVSDAGDPRYVHDTCTIEALAHLASASAVLRALHLGHLPLPEAAMHVVSKLTALTSLELLCCDLNGPDGELSQIGHSARDVDAVSALTSLRELRYEPVVNGYWPECQKHLACLTSIHTLALRGSYIDAEQFASLCTSLPQLRLLDLGGSDRIRAGFSALHQLSNLESVDLTSAIDVALLREVVPPNSLKRCYMGHLTNECDRQRARKHFRRHVQVVFEGQWHNWWVAPEIRGNPFLADRIRGLPMHAHQ
jgi:hypothetical protein